MLTRHGKSEAFVEAMLGQHRHRWSRATHDQGWREVKCACAPALSRRASASLSRMNAVASDLTDAQDLARWDTQTQTFRALHLDPRNHPVTYAGPSSKCANWHACWSASFPCSHCAGAIIVSSTDCPNKRYAWTSADYVTARITCSVIPTAIANKADCSAKTDTCLENVRGAAETRASVQQPVTLLPRSELTAWLSAARNFVINTDFDVGPLLADRKRSITELMNVMKANSGGKGTIQADHINRTGDLQHMPVLLSTYTKVNKAEVGKLVETWTQSSDPDAYDVVVKPTHLSSATGAVIMSKPKWEKEQWSAQKLIEHMETFLEKKAADSESEALKSLVPGFVIQPRYRSSVGFNFPLELRVVTIWGKARVGIWWWGRVADPKGKRTTWLVRVPRISGQLSDDDGWEVIHEHGGQNRGFEVSLKLFREAMPAMSAAAENIATAVGAPFLRSDFFVGSEEWGVRLNEVAYGSGVDYKRRLPGGTSKQTRGGTWVAGPGPDAEKGSREEAPTRGRSPDSRPAEPLMKVEAVPQEKRSRQLPDDAVRDLIGLYKSPGNMLSQTGQVQASSCETQPAQDIPNAGHAGLSARGCAMLFSRPVAGSPFLPAETDLETFTALGAFLRGRAGGSASTSGDSAAGKAHAIQDSPCTGKPDSSTRGECGHLETYAGLFNHCQCLPSRKRTASLCKVVTSFKLTVVARSRQPPDELQSLRIDTRPATRCVLDTVDSILSRF
eukprot:s6240_g3.t1